MVTAKTVDRAEELKDLQRELESYRVKVIQNEAARAAAEDDRAELLAWFKENGFNVKKDLTKQVEDLADEVIADAEALLEALD